MNHTNRTPVEIEMQSELRFIDKELFNVLRNSDIRALLFELADDVKAGDDLGHDLNWRAISAEEIQELVCVATRAAICRILLAILVADGEVSSVEILFARRTLDPLLNEINLRMTAPIASLEGDKGVRQLQAALNDAPKSLFHACGIGGRASSLLRFCSLCDPFVDAPLLPILLRIVHQLSFNCAIADGISRSEEKVIASIDRLADRCNDIAANVSQQMPHVRSFAFDEKDDADLSELIDRQNTLRGESKSLSHELKKSQTTSNRIGRRLDDNLRRDANFIGESWNFSTLFIGFACLAMASGIGWISADFSGSIALGLILATSIFVCSLTLVIKKLLHFSWYSTTALIRERRAVCLNRYRCWKELSNVDSVLANLRQRTAPLKAQRDLNVARQEVEESIRRKQSIDSFREVNQHSTAVNDAILAVILFGSLFVFLFIVVVGSGPSSAGSGSGGPVHVRGYTRQDGTYVSPHTRRR